MVIKVTAETPVSDEVKNHPHTKLCAGPCGRWTRGTGMSIERFPATVVRAVDGKCQKCLNDERRANPETRLKADADLRHTVTGLNNWLADRRGRMSRNGMLV